MLAQQDGSKVIVSFIGPPGSGKGTIAQVWQKLPGVVVLSTGALCRDHIRQQTSFGKQLDGYIAKGQLIPDELMGSMVREWVRTYRHLYKTILLDGYPRTGKQVYDLAGIVRDELASFTPHVVLFEISHDTILQRIAHRLICTNTACQKVYSDSVTTGACTDCGAVLIRRHDDFVDVVKERLKVYEINKAALLAAYGDQGIAIKVFNVEQVPLNEMFTQFSQMMHL